MGKEIAIKTESLAYDITQMQSRHDFILREMSDVYEAIAKLDTMWEGPANLEFIKQFQKDYESMEELCEVIQNIIDCLVYARDAYEKCDKEVNSIVSSIRV